jgi:predicted transcriptional regulator
MVKTTLYLDDGVALKLKRMARSQNRSQAELIREILARLTEGRVGTLPEGLGKFESGRSDLSSTYRSRLTQAFGQAKRN